MPSETPHPEPRPDEHVRPDAATPSVTDALHALRADEAARIDELALERPELAELAGALAEQPQLRQELSESVTLDDQVRAALLATDDAPEDLPQRILAYLDEAGEKMRPTPRSATRPALSPALPSRRRWLRAAIGAVALTVVAGVATLVFFSPEPAPVSRDRAISVAETAFADHARRVKQVGEAGAWEIPTKAPASRAASEFVLAPLHGWQAARTEIDGAAVIFDVTPRALAPTDEASAPRAWLLVMRADSPVIGLPSAPPGQPQMTTGGRTLAAWVEGDMVYAILIEGANHEDVYRDVTRSNGPVA